MSSKERIDAQQKEIAVYDKAINEIETNYGHIIFSEDFYVDNDN
jgi:hypothetical protein